MERVLNNTEQGGMCEVLTNLYSLTGKPEYLKLARRFDEQHYIVPLSQYKDVLKGEHVNSFIPNIIGAAREYEMTGDVGLYAIASFFWRQVTGARSYVTGGTSNGEGWQQDPYVMASELGADSHETCCTYNMLKLTRHLFNWEAKAGLADYYERALFNGILSTQNPADGMMMYYVPMMPGMYKTFMTPEDSFWCCTGTGMENHAKYGDSIYFHGADSLYVNLFIASELSWPEKGLTVRQDTKFPEEQGTKITITAARPVELALNLRIPGWIAAGGYARLNGKKLEAFAAPSSYLTLRRTWKTGDTVELALPMDLRLDRLPDDPKIAAILYGPDRPGRPAGDRRPGRSQDERRIRARRSRGRARGRPEIPRPGKRFERLDQAGGRPGADLPNGGGGATQRRHPDSILQAVRRALFGLLDDPSSGTGRIQARPAPPQRLKGRRNPMAPFSKAAAPKPPSKGAAKPVLFKTPAAWRTWLEKNHAKETEIWLAYYKKGTGKKSVTYKEALDEALCFGWIDSVINRIDDERYMQRWTPRNPRSIWSAANKSHIRRLKAEGRMAAPGLAAIAVGQKERFLEQAQRNRADRARGRASDGSFGRDRSRPRPQSQVRLAHALAPQDARLLDRFGQTAGDGRPPPRAAGGVYRHGHSARLPGAPVEEAAGIRAIAVNAHSGSRSCRMNIRLILLSGGGRS